MAAIENKKNQNSPSPSERMTEAWRKIVQNGQLGLYMATRPEDIEQLNNHEEIPEKYKHIVEYSRAVQKLIEAQQKQQ